MWVECASDRLSFHKEAGKPWCVHCQTPVALSKPSPPRGEEEIAEA